MTDARDPDGAGGQARSAGRPAADGGSRQGTAASARDARLAAALRANLARRKAQGRARAAGDAEMADEPANETRADGRTNSTSGAGTGDRNA